MKVLARHVHTLGFGKGYAHLKNYPSDYGICRAYDSNPSVGIVGRVETGRRGAPGITQWYGPGFSQGRASLGIEAAEPE